MRSNSITRDLLSSSASGHHKLSTFNYPQRELIRVTHYHLPARNWKWKLYREMNFLIIFTSMRTQRNVSFTSKLNTDQHQMTTFPSTHCFRISNVMHVENYRYQLSGLLIVFNFVTILSLFVTIAIQKNFWVTNSAGDMILTSLLSYPYYIASEIKFAIVDFA